MILRCSWGWLWVLAFVFSTPALLGADLLDLGDHNFNSTIEAQNWTLVVFDTTYSGDREATINLRLLSTSLEGKVKVGLVDGPTSLSLRDRFRVRCSFPFPLYPTFRLVR